MTIFVSLLNTKPDSKCSSFPNLFRRISNVPDFSATLANTGAVGADALDLLALDFTAGDVVDAAAVEDDPDAFSESSTRWMISSFLPDCFNPLDLQYAIK
jgi:hypothetical protein